MGAPAGPAPAACTRLAAGLPDTVGAGLRRRAVRSDPARTAAWGEPPVTLACGVPAPPTTGDQVQLGPPGGPLVTFSVADSGGATAFTTVGLPTPVRVTVPSAYDSTLLVPLSAAVAAAQTG